MQRKIRLFGNLARIGQYLSVGMILYGSCISWVRFAVFNTKIEVPGVILGGAATITLAFFSLTVARKIPILRLILGILIIAIALYSQKTLGEVIVRQMLGIEQSLFEVNSRLAQVTLPAIEPFGRIGVRQDHLGPGPLWTLWGGIILSLFTVAELTLSRRYCPHCKANWALSRNIVFCPQCGKRPEAQNACPQCGKAIERGDKFCTSCGQTVNYTSNIS